MRERCAASEATVPGGATAASRVPGASGGSEPPGDAATAHVRTSNAASTRFFEEHADLVARACRAMAERFRAGGRLLVLGDHARRSDVSHVVVEFVHPVIVGKRALPTLALPIGGSPADLSLLDTFGREGDILMLFTAGEATADAATILGHASTHRMLTLLLSGTAMQHDGAALQADFHFAVPSNDPLVVQESHEMLYHILWELVHVFLEHDGQRR